MLEFSSSTPGQKPFQTYNLTNHRQTNITGPLEAVLSGNSAAFCPCHAGSVKLDNTVNLQDPTPSWHHVSPVVATSGHCSTQGCQQGLEVVLFRVALRQQGLCHAAERLAAKQLHMAERHQPVDFEILAFSSIWGAKAWHPLSVALGGLQRFP